MKSYRIAVPGAVDRVPTSEEIRAAVWLSLDRAEEFLTEILREIRCEIAAGFGGDVHIPEPQIESLTVFDDFMERQVAEQDSPVN